MSTLVHNEEQAANAFSRQSAVFDSLYGDNIIIRYKRDQVRAHLQQWLAPNSDVLELNSGTGEDALWFAAQGHRVHATDISAGMQQVLTDKVKAAGFTGSVSTEQISFTQLEQLQAARQYDLIFSNFAGLNCTGELGQVVSSFSPLLKSGGIVTLVLMPKFCLWEFLLLFKGRFKTAFRRFFSSKGVKAHIEGTYFRCWYYDPSYLISKMKKEYEWLGTEGLCTLVPPSYCENFPKKYPGSFNLLKAKEEKWKSRWPWKHIGDYYIISFRKK